MEEEAFMYLRALHALQELIGIWKNTPQATVVQAEIVTDAPP
jgi:hypothetical protein